MNHEPTLADVPGILLRTLLRFVARVLFGVAGAFLMVGVALTLSGVWLATFRSARTDKLRALSHLIESLVEVYREFRQSH